MDRRRELDAFLATEERRAFRMAEISVACKHEALPSMEFLLFLADYTDEEGNWDDPTLEESSDELPDMRGEEK